jgi:regulator of protease activity HflC (stomatin/prohibitin superfamily)
VRAAAIVLALLRALARAAAAVLGLGTRIVAAIAGLRAVRATARVVVLGCAAAGLVLGVGSTCLVRLPPGTIGVQQLDLGGRGIAEKDHRPGIVLGLPLLESWHRIDGTTQVLSYGWETEGGELPLLDLRTREGTSVKVGAAIVHRVRAGEAWQLVRDGLKNAWTRRVRSAAEDALARAVGGLTAAELQDPDARLDCARSVAAELDRALAPDHVEVERVLLTQVWFGPTYEKQLQARQLAAQQLLLQSAAADVEAQRSRIELFQQETENSLKAISAELDEEIARRAAAGRAEIAAVQAGTKAYVDARKAEAQAERDRLVLEGERTLARAQALKEGLMRKALATAGGRLWLARSAAENLNIRQVTLNSNDPRVPSILDLDAIVKLLIGGSARP